MVGTRNRMAGGEQEAKGGKDRGGGKGGGGRRSEEGDERVFGLRAVSILPATPTALQEPEPTQAVGDGNNTRGAQAREEGAEEDGYDRGCRQPGCGGPLPTRASPNMENGAISNPRPWPRAARNPGPEKRTSAGDRDEDTNKQMWFDREHTHLVGPQRTVRAWRVGGRGRA